MKFAIFDNYYEYFEIFFTYSPALFPPTKETALIIGSNVIYLVVSKPPWTIIVNLLKYIINAKFKIIVKFKIKNNFKKRRKPIFKTPLGNPTSFKYFASKSTKLNKNIYLFCEIRMVKNSNWMYL